MSIEGATAIITGVVILASTYLSVFVNYKIGASETRMMDRMAQTYLPREVAADRFRHFDTRLDDLRSPPPWRASKEVE